MSYMEYFEHKSQPEIRQEECVSQIEHILGYDIFHLRHLLAKGYELVPPHPKRNLEEMITMDKRLFPHKNTKSSMALDSFVKESRYDEVLEKLKKIVEEATNDGKD